MPTKTAINNAGTTPQSNPKRLLEPMIEHYAPRQVENISCFDFKQLFRALVDLQTYSLNRDIRA
jgi:hypothetical protein